MPTIDDLKRMQETTFAQAAKEYTKQLWTTAKEHPVSASVTAASLLAAPFNPWLMVPVAVAGAADLALLKRDRGSYSPYYSGFTRGMTCAVTWFGSFIVGLQIAAATTDSGIHYHQPALDRAKQELLTCSENGNCEKSYKLEGQGFNIMLSNVATSCALDVEIGSQPVITKCVTRANVSGQVDGASFNITAFKTPFSGQSRWEAGKFTFNNHGQPLEVPFVPKKLVINGLELKPGQN